MTPSTLELAKARDAARNLLEALKLDAYLFEVEPGEGDNWRLTLECAAGDGWQRSSWRIDVQELLRSIDDQVVCSRLLRDWSTHVAACRQTAT